VCFVGQAHELQPVPGNGLGLVVRRGRRASKGRGHNYIAQGSEVQKWADHLKGTGNTAFAYGVTGQPMNRFALQEYTPPVRSKLPGNKIEQGSFSRSIRTNEPGNLALLDGAVYLMQRQQPAEAFVTSQTSSSFIGYSSLIIACSSISTSRLSLHLLFHISPPLRDLHPCLQDFFQKRGGFHMHQLSRGTSHGLDRLPEPCGSSTKLFHALSRV
jgi:hypothetical protein